MSQQRARAEQREATSDVIEMESHTPARDFEEMLTADDIRELQACADAEAAGDVQRAIRHYAVAPHLVPDLHGHHLWELARLGSEAPGWVWSRWITHQTYRWLLQEEDPRIQHALVLALVAAYPDVDIENPPFGLDMYEFGTRVAATDWICQQLCVYEMGGLVDFLDVRASGSLVPRADQARSWAQAPMGGYRIDAHDGDRLVLTDLATDEELEVLNIGATTDRCLGVAVLGRVVPVSVAPGRMFESRPVEVDASTARAAARAVAEGDPDAWLWPILDAREDGRLPLLFSTGLRTPLTSDIVPEWPHVADVADDIDEGEAESSGRIQGLIDAGLSTNAANGVAVCEVGLIAAAVSRDGTPVCSPHVAVVLVDPQVYAAAREHCTRPDQQQGWTALAECMPEPMRTRCRELARLCAEKRTKAS